jgi:hypothetical protein
MKDWFHTHVRDNWKCTNTGGFPDCAADVSGALEGQWRRKCGTSAGDMKPPLRREFDMLVRFLSGRAKPNI